MAPLVIAPPLAAYLRMDAAVRRAVGRRGAVPPVGPTVPFPLPKPLSPAGARAPAGPPHLPDRCLFTRRRKIRGEKKILPKR